MFTARVASLHTITRRISCAGVVYIIVGINELSIVGIGTDLVEIRRIEEACKRERFAERVFTPAELRNAGTGAKRWERLAGRFAAKEAVGKAFGRPLSWQDVEIAKDDLGKPIVVLHGNAAELACGARVHVSISHTSEYATAFAVMER